MMLRFLFMWVSVVIMCSFFVEQGRAQDYLSVDLARNAIDITTGFDGDELIVYGASKVPGHVAVVVSGPEKTMIVRHKQQVLGAWINTKSLEFRRVPSFYSYALSGPEDGFPAQRFLDEKSISLDTLGFYAEEDVKDDELDRFRKALIRRKQEEGLYLLKPLNVEYINDTFFKAKFMIPASVPTGIYTVTMYLLGDNHTVVEREQAEFTVGQVGFSAKIYLFAQNSGLLYGLLAVLMALSAGGLAYSVFRRE